MNSSTFTQKTNSHAAEVETHARQKLRHLLLCQSKAILSKKYRLVTRSSLHMDEFNLGYKNRDLGNRARLTSPIELFTK